jgi:hypothetical protein
MWLKQAEANNWTVDGKWENKAVDHILTAFEEASAQIYKRLNEAAKIDQELLQTAIPAIGLPELRTDLPGNFQSTEDDYSTICHQSVRSMLTAKPGYGDAIFVLDRSVIQHEETRFQLPAASVVLSGSWRQYHSWLGPLREKFDVNKWKAAAKRVRGGDVDTQKTKWSVMEVVTEFKHELKVGRRMALSLQLKANDKLATRALVKGMTALLHQKRMTLQETDADKDLIGALSDGRLSFEQLKEEIIDVGFPESEALDCVTAAHLLAEISKHKKGGDFMKKVVNRLELIGALSDGRLSSEKLKEEFIEVGFPESKARDCDTAAHLLAAISKSKDGGDLMKQVVDRLPKSGRVTSKARQLKSMYLNCSGLESQLFHIEAFLPDKLTYDHINILLMTKTALDQSKLRRRLQAHALSRKVREFRDRNHMLSWLKAYQGPPLTAEEVNDALTMRAVMRTTSKRGAQRALMTVKDAMIKMVQEDGDHNFARLEEVYENAGCYTGTASILLMDGSTKFAKDVQIGDKLAARHGPTAAVMTHTTVIGRHVQSARSWKLIKIGDLMISSMHRIVFNGQWIEPSFHPAAEVVCVHDEALYNFVVDGCLLIQVNDILVSTVGTYCEGSHDFQWPTHELWGSRHIIDILRQHPGWPEIYFHRQDNLIDVLKNPSFAAEYLATKPEHAHALLRKHGWSLAISDDSTTAMKAIGAAGHVMSCLYLISQGM